MFLAIPAPVRADVADLILGNSSSEVHARFKLGVQIRFKRDQSNDPATAGLWELSMTHQRWMITDAALLVVRDQRVNFFSVRVFQKPTRR